MAAFATGANVLQQSFRQRLYLRSDFHHLNAPGVGTIGSLRIDDFRTTAPLGHLIVPRRRPVEI